MPSSPDVRASIRQETEGPASPASFALTSHRDSPAGARLEGFRAGREEGFEVGRVEGWKTSAAAVAGALGALEAAADNCQRTEAAALESVEKLAVLLAVELAEVLIGRQLEEIEPGSDVIARALGLRRGVEPVRVRMHPDDAAVLDDVPHPDIEVVADATLARGQAAAEIGEGLADLSIAAAIDRVRAALT